MRNKRLAFIDIETTGTNPEKHEILEIGCVLVDPTGNDFKVVEEFDLKVKPEHIENAEIEALRINGYHESDWLFASSQKSALEHISKKCDGCVMVAQNVSFDYAFLVNAFSRYDVLDPFYYSKLDTIPMAYALVPRLEDFSLRKLADHFFLKNEKAHTALADARVTFEVFKELMKLAKK